jgi:uncharacterized protein
VTLIEALQNPALFKHSVEKFEVIETHISWVLLTGRYAYKIKKPVDFGFLDFSSLEKRHFYCKEEVRLNRRLAPRLYLEVVTISGSAAQPDLEGQGPVIEYAVKMRQFPQSAQLDRLLSDEGLDHHLIDKLATKVADFHVSIKSASVDSAFGDLEHIRQPILENFQHIRGCINDTSVEPILRRLERWSQQQLDELADLIQQRKAEGFVRECHGDMHLRNIAWWDEEVVIFDCIEFNKNLFWIDVISDIAFLVMDLEDRQQHALANRFLNRYLEITGDYVGVQLLKFYKVYRALVRAKVDALRVGQELVGTQAYDETFQDFVQYLQLAEHYINPASPSLLINHGFSGSGKSYASRMILEKFPAIQIRSDVERKRMFQVPWDKAGPYTIEEGIYTSDATRRTYMRLVKITSGLLRAGYSVLVDAANLKQQQRQLFIDLANSLTVPFLIIDYQASVDTLRRRIKKRAQQRDDVSDATLAVLEHQLATVEPFSDAEQPFVMKIDTDQAIEVDHIVGRIRGCID